MMKVVLLLAVIISLTVCSKNEKSQSSNQSTTLKPTEQAIKKNTAWGNFIDSRDQRIYRSVKIGNQIWMAENLNFDTKGSFCFNNSLDSCQKYGRLYNWQLAQNICPPGWHIPSKNEWNELARFIAKNVGSKQDGLGDWPKVGSLLKDDKLWDSFRNKSGNGTNTYKFTGMPAGGCEISGGSLDCDAFGEDAVWWTRSAVGLKNSDQAILANISYSDDDLCFLKRDKQLNVSIRCVED